MKDPFAVCVRRRVVCAVIWTDGADASHEDWATSCLAPSWTLGFFQALASFERRKQDAEDV